MRIFCDAYGPWTVLCVHTQHLSARSSGLTLLCSSHDWGRGGIFDVYSCIWFEKGEGGDARQLPSGFTARSC